MKMHLFRFGILVSALALATQAALAQAPSPQAVSLYNLGLTAYKQGSPESAVIFFKRATDIDPNLADAQYNLGVIYMTQKRYREAIPRFQEVLRIKPTDPDAHYQLGVIFQEVGQLQDAKQHFANIPPSNARFGDAQGRVAAINQRLAQGPGAQASDQMGAAPLQMPVQTYQQPAAQPQAYQPANSDLYQTAPPHMTPPAQNTGSGTTYYDQQAPGNYGAGNAPAAVQMQTTQQMTSAIPVQPVLSAPVAPPNPIPVLANTSLKVVATGFSAPSGLAFDKYGNLYVANYLTNTIDRITSDGSRSRFSSGTNLKGPIGLIVDDSNNVYVANYNAGSVARISPAGIATIIATGFRKPYYLALDHDGNLYVSQQEDNSIVRISLPRPITAKP